MLSALTSAMPSPIPTPEDKQVLIYDRSFWVGAGELSRLASPGKENMTLLSGLDRLNWERGVIQESTALAGTDQKIRLVCAGITHGGYVPLILHTFFDEIHFVETAPEHAHRIRKNLEGRPEHRKFRWFDSWDGYDTGLLSSVGGRDTLVIVYEDMGTPMPQSLRSHIVLSRTIHSWEEDGAVSSSYAVHDGTTSTLHASIPFPMVDAFVRQLTGSKDLDKFNEIETQGGRRIKQIVFPNLIHLCIMVKNAGPGFRDVLESALLWIDRWTILDTGSTDGTLAIIHEVLVGKKPGRIYQEPFVNFRDSRNRLLDLAQASTIFLIMLDDTYTIRGEVRPFLTEVRGDARAEALSTMMQTDDTVYTSARIVRSHLNPRYRYRIHEVFDLESHGGGVRTNNFLVPHSIFFIHDETSEGMRTRSHQRNRWDLQMLRLELEEDPMNARILYYLGQTHLNLEEYENAYEYFYRRGMVTESGLFPERVNALIEAGRIADEHLHRPWSECETLFKMAFQLHPIRPDALYFLAVHEFNTGRSREAYEYLREGFRLGWHPQEWQFSVRPTLVLHYLPLLLTRLCYGEEDFALGLQAARFFIEHVSSSYLPASFVKERPHLQEMESWVAIFGHLADGIDHTPNPELIMTATPLPIVVFVADGGWAPWWGSSLLSGGIGGSETFIIEMARHLQKQGHVQVYVFCPTPGRQSMIQQGVVYHHLNHLPIFLRTTPIRHCLVSRYSEYIPLCFMGLTETVSLIVHDLTTTGSIIPQHPKLASILCLTPWHVEYFTGVFPMLRDRIIPFSYGIDPAFRLSAQEKAKCRVRHRFIYSSFANRGLLPLLQIWPRLATACPSVSLDLFCDVNHEYCERVDPEGMVEIRRLLSLYQKQPELRVVYHGWVSKARLAQGWREADIWFYPCVFLETFCLTALEAAASHTLAVTNGLAALRDTVGDRGYVLEGDPRSPEWQDEAIRLLVRCLGSGSEDQNAVLRQKNGAWAESLAWSKRAEEFAERFLRPDDLEIKGMYGWVHDIPSGTRPIILQILSDMAEEDRGFTRKHPFQILEVGVYTGISLIEFLKRIPNSVGVAIDAWIDSDEKSVVGCIERNDVRGAFLRNLVRSGMKDRVEILHEDSASALLHLLRTDRRFDFIYVDASHRLLDVYTDLLLASRLLAPRGVLGVDDYNMRSDPKSAFPNDGPKLAVDSFLKKTGQDFTIVHKGYRLFLQKK